MPRYNRLAGQTTHPCRPGAPMSALTPFQWLLAILAAPGIALIIWGILSRDRSGADFVTFLGALPLVLVAFIWTIRVYWLAL